MDDSKTVEEIIRDLPKAEKELHEQLAKYPKKIRKTIRIYEFTIIAEDAWGNVFLFSTIEEDADGNISLKVIYENKIYALDIVNQEEFIQKLRALYSINGKSYEFITEDGYNWCLRIAYDNKVIVSCGINAAPSKLYKFFKSFGIEIDIFDMNIGNQKIVNMKEGDDIYIMGNIKMLNRHRLENAAWIENENKYKAHVYNSDECGRIKIGSKG